MKTLEQILEAKNSDKEFEPHMMYDPKTGKGYKAEKPEDHERMKKMGYSHDKPEIKEDVSTAIFGSLLLGLAPFYVLVAKSMADDLKQLKAKSAKKGFKPSKEDQSLLQKFIAMVKRKKPDAVSKAMKKANESVELDEAKSSSGYELYHRDFSGAMQHAYAHAKKKGFIVDKDDVDHKVAMGPKRPSSGKTNKYILDTNKKQKLHVQVANLDNKRYELNMYIESVQLDENYRTLARKGMGTETKKDARVGLEIDFYETERGDKVFGKITKVTGTGYTVQAMERGNSKKYTFKFHDRAKAKKLLEMTEFMENYRAKRDAMAAMGKRGKDSADIDNDATDDDRKAASKNVLMQIRKASDLPKGGDIEFPDTKKKGKISQDDAKRIVKLFDILKKPADKQKFQKVISKDLNSIKGLLKRLGR